MNILPNDLGRQYSLHAAEYEAKALEVLRSGWYILGREVEQFEKEWAGYIGSKYCVGLASGLDALWISFRLLGIGRVRGCFSSSRYRPAMARRSASNSGR